MEVTTIDRRQAREVIGWMCIRSFADISSAYYGVNVALGEDALDEAARRRYYERATGGDEVFRYFAEVARRLRRQAEPACLLAHEYLDAGVCEQVREIATGELHDVAVRRKVVDARYLDVDPAIDAAPFQVALDVRLIPLTTGRWRRNQAAALFGPGTAADARIWLLSNHVQPDRIRWSGPGTLFMIVATFSH